MTYTIRKSAKRGHFDHGWLKTYHTFSFADYYDPQFMGFKSLRVINEDFVAPGQGFPPHAHKNMEILTIIVEGNLAHRDSIYSDEEVLIHTDEIQLMTAGSGIVHSEYNPSDKEGVHLLQIWVLPKEPNLNPRYEQKRLTYKPNTWLHIVSKAAKEGTLLIHQDADIYIGKLDTGKELDAKLDKGRSAWVQLISGKVTINGETLEKGDGIAIEKEEGFKIQAEEPSHVLYFDLL